MIDELPPEKLQQVSEYIEFLHFKEERKDPDWFGKLYDLFAPVRAEVAASGMTEEEVNQLIDDAIEKVRAERKSEQNRA